MGRYLAPAAPLETRFVSFPPNPKIAIARHPSQIDHGYVPLRIAPAPAKRVDVGRDGDGRREGGMGVFKSNIESGAEKKNDGEEVGKTIAAGDGNVVVVEDGEMMNVVGDKDGVDGVDEDEGKDEGRRSLRSSSGRRK
jgi:hypothetical protein